MMYAELYQYLISYQQLPVPGIGTFLWERKPAVNDFFNKRINPPTYSIFLQPSSGTPSKFFFNWLANTLHISEQEAVVQFNDFANDIKNTISNGGIIDWNNVGLLSKGLAGEIKFIPAETEMVFEKPVIAEKVIRQNAQHMIRVGEDNKTSAEMVEMLNYSDEKKSYWWVYALSLVLLGLVFLGWYFSQYGLDVSSTGNNATLTPLEAGRSYKVVP
ncbi:MAG: hypothetical protein ABIU11_06645 [Chitinophagaceae bacterium]